MDLPLCGLKIDYRIRCCNCAAKRIECVRPNRCCTNFATILNSNQYRLLDNIVITGASEKMIMERLEHNMSNLFAQLGQANDETAIAQFIETHRPLAEGVQLHEAPFWTPSQACFLREAITQDADWAEVADSLSAELRARH